MKVLVIGLNGQLARSLKERRTGRTGFELLFVGRPEVDLSVPGAIESAIIEAAPDSLINVAAYTDVDRAEKERETAFRVNAYAAGEAAAAAKRVGASIVHISTDYVFDGRSTRPWRENDPVNPVNVYGTSKAEGEELVKLANPQHLIIRTSWIVSPFGRNFIKTIMDAAHSRPVLRVVNDQRGRPTSALELAEAIFTILEKWRSVQIRSPGTYHLSGSGEASWYELAAEVLNEWRMLGGPATELTPITSEEWPTPALRPSYSVLDCSRVQADLGLSLPDWRESVRKIVRRLVVSSGL